MVIPFKNDRIVRNNRKAVHTSLSVWLAAEWFIVSISAKSTIDFCFYYYYLVPETYSERKQLTREAAGYVTSIVLPKGQLDF